MDNPLRASSSQSRLVLGECLKVCEHLEPGCLDLIYCDPPFFTRRRQKKQNYGYEDSWPSLEAYLDWLKPRVQGIFRVLKPDGVFVLHLDWHVVHYAKVLCDQVFGYKHFINEIIWCFRTGGTSKRALARKHDTLLVYGKGKDYAFSPQREKSYVAHKYGFSNIVLEEDKQGFYRYVNMRDVWEIPALRGNQPETCGYPTQKPLELLNRLFDCFLPEGAIVGDFFCGSGTSALAANMRGNAFVCSDSSPEALELVQKRLGKAAPKIEKRFKK